MSFKKILAILIIFTVGVITGGYLFRDVQPRSFLRVESCDKNCFTSSELLGLVGSVGVQNLKEVVPYIIKETDKTVVMDSPVHAATIHYVIIPKKDIKDAGDISETDKDYLADAYAVMREIIKEENLRKYKIYTNGPGYQTVNYLHFHLLANK